MSRTLPAHPFTRVERIVGGAYGLLKTLGDLYGHVGWREGVARGEITGGNGLHSVLLRHLRRPPLQPDPHWYDQRAHFAKQPAKPSAAKSPRAARTVMGFLAAAGEALFPPLSPNMSALRTIGALGGKRPRQPDDPDPA